MNTLKSILDCFEACALKARFPFRSKISKISLQFLAYSFVSFFADQPVSELFPGISQQIEATLLCEAVYVLVKAIHRGAHQGTSYVLGELKERHNRRAPNT